MTTAERQESRIAPLQNLGKSANMVNCIARYTNPRKMCQILALSGIALLLIFGQASAADILRPTGKMVYDRNGERFLISGCGEIIQKNYTYDSHAGINSVDYKMNLGEVVMAAFPGTIVRADADSAHGVFVIVEGDNGITGRYYHLGEADLEILKSRIGEHVELGGKLGRVGKTGNTSGNHYGLELGYINPDNPRNNYFSATYDQRIYYNTIIERVALGQFIELELHESREAK